MAVSKRLGEVLVEMGYVDPRVVQAALEEQRRSPRRLGKILVEMGAINEERLVRALSLQLGIDICDPVAGPVGGNARAMLPVEIATRCRMIPMSLRRDETGQTLFVATADPHDRTAIDQLRMHVGPTMRIRWMLASESEIELALTRHYGAQASAVFQAPHTSQAPHASQAPAPRYAPAPVITGVPISGPRPASPPAAAEDPFEVVSLASSMRELDVRGRAPSSPPGHLTAPNLAGRGDGAYHTNDLPPSSPVSSNVPLSLLPSSELPIDPVRAPFATRDLVLNANAGAATGSLPKITGTADIGAPSTSPRNVIERGGGGGTGDLGSGAYSPPPYAPSRPMPRPLPPRPQNGRAPSNIGAPPAPIGSIVTAPVTSTSSSIVPPAPVPPPVAVAPPSSAPVVVAPLSSAPPVAPLSSAPAVVAPRSSSPISVLHESKDADSATPILTLDEVVESLPGMTDGLSGLEVRPKPAPVGALPPEQIRLAELPAMVIGPDPELTPEPIEILEPHVRKGGAAALPDSRLPPMPPSSWADLVGARTGSIDIPPGEGPPTGPPFSELDIPIDEGPMIDGVSGDLPRMSSKTGDMARLRESSKSGDLARVRESSSHTGETARLRDIPLEAPRNRERERAAISISEDLEAPMEPSASEAERAMAAEPGLVVASSRDLSPRETASPEPPLREPEPRAAEPEAARASEPTRPPEVARASEPTRPPEVARAPEPTRPPEITREPAPEPVRVDRAPAPAEPASAEPELEAVDDASVMLLDAFDEAVSEPSAPIEVPAPAEAPPAPSEATGSSLDVARIRAVIDRATSGGALDAATSTLLVRVLAGVLADAGLLDDAHLARALARLDSKPD